MRWRQCSVRHLSVRWLDNYKYVIPRWREVLCIRMERAEVLIQVFAQYKETNAMTYPIKCTCSIEKYVG